MKKLILSLLVAGWYMPLLISGETDCEFVVPAITEDPVAEEDYNTTETVLFEDNDEGSYSEVFASDADLRIIKLKPAVFQTKPKHLQKTKPVEKIVTKPKQKPIIKPTTKPTYFVISKPKPVAPSKPVAQKPVSKPVVATINKPVAPVSTEKQSTTIASSLRTTYTNPTLAGTVSVTGPVTSTSTISASGNISSTAGVVKAKSLQINSNKFTVSTTGNTAAAGSLDVTGNFNVATDAFTVVAATGNTTIGGTLDVLEAASLHGAAAIDGELTAAGALNVVGATTLNATTIDSTLNVTGLATLSGGLAGAKIIADSSISGINAQHIFDAKTTVSYLDAAGTTALTITFTNMAGTLNPLKKGAFVKINCITAGLIGSEKAEHSYDGILWVSPGATSGTTVPAVQAISETTKYLNGGTAATISASTAGTGATVNIKLTDTKRLGAPNTIIFYEILSDNIASVA